MEPGMATSSTGRCVEECRAGNSRPASSSFYQGRLLVPSKAGGEEMTLPRRRKRTVLVPTTLQNLHAGDTCVVDDGNYSHGCGQLVVVIDRSTSSEVHPPPGENRWPVLVPESVRILLLAPSTPVLVAD